MSQNKRFNFPPLAYLMEMLYTKSGATIRGIRREARMGQDTVRSCRCGEIYQFSPTSVS